MNLKRSGMIARQRAANTSQPELIIMSEEIEQFATDNFDRRPDTSGPWWNGRQIRNAFQIATSLAYLDPSGGKERSNRYLGRYHFEQVLQFIQGYDQYRQNLFEKTDSELAGTREQLNPAQGEATGRRKDRRRECQRAPHYSLHSSSLSATSSSNRGTQDR
ncbi:Ff.00g055420.m01.CDS01 [Fusarium sp. VM40]|nr:Ff.00g055420.m01.CDS01 [Fusarium sp. VM40]